MDLKQIQRAQNYMVNDKSPFYLISLAAPRNPRMAITSIEQMRRRSTKTRSMLKNITISRSTLYYI